MKNKLIMTVGFPRSGKSTWARKTPYPMVNPDSIRLALHGQRYLQEAEPMVWVLTKIMIKSLFLAGHPTVILDSTNLLASKRKEWESDDWEIVLAHRTETEEECVVRAESEGDSEIIPVIRRMAAALRAEQEVSQSNDK